MSGDELERIKQGRFLIDGAWIEPSDRRRFDIVSPSPVPPYFRVVEVSACVKGAKMTSHLSAGTPIPVSETVKCRSPSLPCCAPA